MTACGRRSRAKSAPGRKGKGPSSALRPSRRRPCWWSSCWGRCLFSCAGSNLIPPRMARNTWLTDSRLRCSPWRRPSISGKSAAATRRNARRKSSPSWAFPWRGPCLTWRAGGRLATARKTWKRKSGWTSSSAGTGRRKTLCNTASAGSQIIII